MDTNEPSEQSRLDAAVEVAVHAFQTDVTPDGNGCVGPHTKMRAALLAAMPVLLGEPVACMHPDTLAMLSSDTRAKHVKAERPSELNLLDGYVPLYTPSLGEGDGR